MDQYKINDIIAKINSISNEPSMKVKLYEQLLPYTLGCMGFYDNVMVFLNGLEGAPEASGSSAASSASSVSSVSSASPFDSASYASGNFAPSIIPTPKSMQGYGLGSGSTFLKKPLNLSAYGSQKKSRRKTQRRRRQ